MSNQTLKKQDSIKPFIAEQSQFTKLCDIVKNTMEAGFYGCMEIKFEAGKVTIVKKTESLKL